MSQNELDLLIDQLDNKFIKALAEPARLELIKELAKCGEADVQTLSKNMPQDRSVISRHMSTLADAGIVKCRKDGRHLLYKIDGDSTLKKSQQILDAMKGCIMQGCC